MGSLGRREMAPYSDLDVIVVAPQRDDPRVQALADAAPRLLKKDAAIGDDLAFVLSQLKAAAAMEKLGLISELRTAPAHVLQRNLIKEVGERSPLLAPQATNAEPLDAPPLGRPSLGDV